MSYFFHVCWRMKIVRVEEDPAKASSEQLADSSLARAGRPHHEYDHAARPSGYALHRVMRVISGDTPSRTGAPTVPRPRFTYNCKEVSTPSASPLPSGREYNPAM